MAISSGDERRANALAASIASGEEPALMARAVTTERTIWPRMLMLASRYSAAAAALAWRFDRLACPATRRPVFFGRPGFRRAELLLRVNEGSEAATARGVSGRAFLAQSMKENRLLAVC
jgi:hypothetical protein